MQYYCRIDLHSNNHYMCVIYDNDKRLIERKLVNDSRLLIAALSEYKDEVVAVAIELTFNWYWLSDALTEAKSLENIILEKVNPMSSFELLKTTDGIGNILALVILLETGDIKRFKGSGNYAAYCRCVDSKRESNGKRKGEGNRKNGNKYLSWAYIEAANFSIRHNAKAQQFYQRKKSKTNQVVALKALSHKLARACYHIKDKQVPFDQEKLFT